MVAPTTSNKKDQVSGARLHRLEHHSTTLLLGLALRGRHRLSVDTEGVMGLGPTQGDENRGSLAALSIPGNGC
jgi:hypothetical protein